MRYIFINHKFTKIILFLILILIWNNCFNFKRFYARTNIDYFDYITSVCDANVCEYGVTAEFKNSGDGEKLCNKLFNLFGFNKESDVTVYKDNFIYRIEFERPQANGYIECTKDLQNGDYITINEISRVKDSNINYLKYQFEESLKDQKSKIKYCQYLRAKITSQKEVGRVNEEIITILKDSGALNISSIDIGKGYSNTAYTGQYETIKNEGKLKDLNIAVTEYDTGKYIIIGTPLIKETY